MIYLGNESLPSLKTFAAQRVVQLIEESSPNLCSDLAIRNTRLKNELLMQNQAHEKLINRIKRRESRALGAIHELKYISRKLHEIITKLHGDSDGVVSPQALHFARSELTTLSELQYAKTILQQFVDLSQVRNIFMHETVPRLIVNCIFRYCES